MRRTILPALLLAATASAVFAQPDAPGSHFMAAWDLDGDGAVTTAELAERREMIFNMFDDDQDGVLSSAEYDNFDATRAADMQNAMQAESRGSGPRSGDGAGNGQGNNSGQGGGNGNGQRIGGDSGNGPGGSAMTRAVEGLTRGYNDADGDGAVSLQEFLDGAAPWMARVDQDGDGTITAQDFRPRG